MYKWYWVVLRSFFVLMAVCLIPVQADATPGQLLKTTRAAGRRKNRHTGILFLVFQEGQ
jgi:hypothetical protein